MADPTAASPAGNNDGGNDGRAGPHPQHPQTSRPQQQQPRQQQPPWDFRQQQHWGLHQDQLWNLRGQQQRQQQHQHQASEDNLVETLIAGAGPTPEGVDPEENREELEISARTLLTMPGTVRTFERVAGRIHTTFLRAVLAWQRGEVILTAEEHADVEAAQPLRAR